MSYTIVELALGAGIFGAWWMFKERPKPNAKAKDNIMESSISDMSDVKYMRRLTEIRRTGIATPHLINNMKLILVEHGIKPATTTVKDPAVMLADLEVQLQDLRLKDVSSDTLHPRSNNSSGRKVQDYIAMSRHRDNLYPRSEADGE
jgi:hypothetical protein